jgi:hypothetical protein
MIRFAFFVGEVCIKGYANLTALIYGLETGSFEREPQPPYATKNEASLINWKGC